MYPLLLGVQLVNDQVNLTERALLNLSSLLVCRAILDVIQKVLIRLVTYLTVRVLLVGNGLGQG